MMDDKTLALLGDRAAAERLTEAGVLLECPCCGGTAALAYGSGPYYMFNVRVKCKTCWQQTAPAFYGNNGTIKIEEAHEYGKDKARLLVMRRWNARAPILTPTQIDLLQISSEPRAFEGESK